MTDISKLKKGLSIGFLGGVSKEAFEKCAAQGIDCVEISFKYNDNTTAEDIMSVADFAAALAVETGVELWSVHLPFAKPLDISSLDAGNRDITIRVFSQMIKASASAGIKTVVLHPSEAFPEEERRSRFAYSRDNIRTLAELCGSLSMTLAVENLPPAFLCNTSSETIELLDGIDAAVCFDTNHSLIESNGEYLRGIFAGGLKVANIHISDYDFIDQRHWLPGDGVVNWRETLGLLSEANYSGPMMYEISSKPKLREVPGFEALIDNQCRLMRWQIT